MPTSLALDDELPQEARRVGGHRTKKATVTEALRESILRRRQAGIVRLFGMVDIDPEHSLKRRRR